MICVRKEKFYAVAFIVIMALMAASYLHEYTGFFALEDVIISVIEDTFGMEPWHRPRVFELSDFFRLIGFL